MNLQLPENTHKTISTVKERMHIFLGLLLLLLSFVISGCKDVSPESNQDGGSTKNSGSNSNAVSSYTGPAPLNGDVFAFQQYAWAPLIDVAGCDGCHDIGGIGPTKFVRSDDINQAYSEAATIVNRTNPADSAIVTKVAGGHNCWLSSDSECGTTMTAYLQQWLNGTNTSSSAIQLLPPSKHVDPGNSRVYPADSSLFATYVHPILVARCAGCHTDTAAIPQAPYFANVDVDSAYEAVRISQKIDLDNPPNSRLVVRLRDEFHNCWDTGTGIDCQANATEMENAIIAMANGIAPTQVDPALVFSKALNIDDGIIASGGNRYDANVIALYDFKFGSGNTIFDHSGLEPKLDLTLSGNEDVDFRWVGGWGIEFINSKAQGSTTASKKISDIVKTTGAYTIEAWVVPGNVTQEGPARIVSYSGGTTARNFTLGQTLYNYEILNRSSMTDGNGEPSLSTADADEDLQATQQHVVATYDPVNGRRIYVNGVFTDDVDPQPGGNLSDWDDSFALVLGNEVSNNRPWQGKIRLLAIHNQALTQDQITQNFDAGVGQKFYLLFNISKQLGIPDDADHKCDNDAADAPVNRSCQYIMFEVSQFDNYSYLFNKPTFVNLDPDTDANSFTIKGMRIGLNGKEPSVGQAYSNIDLMILPDDYTSNNRILSPFGTIIASENGPSSDEFFLTFEDLNGEFHSVIEADCIPLTDCPITRSYASASPEIGMRTFDEINATMSDITGVPVTESNVQNTYNTVKQQLPSVENINGFLSAHQMAVAQMSIEYCNTLVEDSTLRTQFFGPFAFTSNVDTAFGLNLSTEKQGIVKTLYDKMIGIPDIADVSLSNVPTYAELEYELIDPANVVNFPTNAGNLFDRLRGGCSGSCDETRTRIIVKAMCATTLGSAVTLMQ
jgi:hypothetical protein